MNATRIGKVARAVISALVVALACSGVVRDAQGAETAKVSVHVEGLGNEQKANVMATLSIVQRKGKLNEPEVRQLHSRATEQIQKALEPYGFYRVTVEPALERQGGRWLASYVVDPGPSIRIDTLSVRVTGPGADHPEFRRLVDRFPLRRGDPLVHPTYELAKKSFMATAMRIGYLDGKFDEHMLRVDLERYTSSIHLHFETGLQYHFGPVVFQQDVVDPDLLQGYVTFRQGDPVDYNKLLELEEKLGQSPYFSRVEVRPDRNPARGTELPIVVSLVPARPEKYTLGVGFGTDNGAHVRSMVELRRLNRRGHRAEAEGAASLVERNAAAKYIMPWPYPRTDVLTLATGYAEVDNQVTREQTAFVGASLGRLWAGWQELFALNYRREKYQVGVDEGNAGFLVPEASWNRLRTNDPIDPTHGQRLRFRVSGAEKSVLSAASYARLEAQSKWIRTFSTRNRLTGRIDAGYNWTKEFRQLPPSARFFAGGAQSVRGFGYNRLGPKDEVGNVIGGPALAIASIEYEFRFRRHWGVALFYDTGNAMTSFSDPLAQGAGTGVRWVSPVGLVRVDVGFPLTGTKNNPEFHLSIGPGL